VTKTPGNQDVKIHMKSRLRLPRAEGGLGHEAMSKTMTPKNYGDDWENPWRTLLMLRAWAIWRASRDGWTAERPGRAREQATQVARLTAALREAQGDDPAPLLGHAMAHSWLQRCVPGIVAGLGFYAVCLRNPVSALGAHR